MKFLNVSNHASGKWTPEQFNAARNYGDVIDVAFPAVPANATSSDVAEMADKVISDLAVAPDDTVMCQGEMTLVFAIVSRLKAMGVRCVAACSERQSVETTDANGNTVKRAVFHFVQFREY